MPEDTQQLEPIGRHLEDKMPPQNREAEESVLGALMIDKDAIIKIADLLHSEDFYSKKHEIVYSAMMDLYAKHEPIDLLSLSNRLEAKKELENIGGSAYLTDLVTRVPTSAHLVHYAKIIQHKASLRRLINSASKITELGYQEDKDIDEILDKAEQEIFSVSQKHISKDFAPIKPMLAQAFERLDSLHKSDGTLRGIATGFSELDNKLAGLQKSDLIILAARPSLGKTSLALDIARSAAVNSGVSVGIFSLEMSKDQLVDRLLCSQGGVDLWKYRAGKLSDQGENNDFVKVNHAIDILSKAPIFIDDSSAANVMQMRTMARRLQAEHDLGLLIVDYLQLMQGNKPTDSRVNEISEISRSLKTLARELNIPILALSQLSRAVESRPDQIPKLSDLRDSGSIEQDSDVVLFIYREDRVKQNSDRPNIADILISKHRNGPVGQVQLYFNEDFASFRSLEKYQPE
ncbi:replicative DNA helicase [bacterium]|nr:replicative DNA helicase [bacterium]|tara:strand:+ start:3644 stop:5026 length:1383 start_codon:yes stop_codon:yes gene_type:complete